MIKKVLFAIMFLAVSCMALNAQNNQRMTEEEIMKVLADMEGQPAPDFTLKDMEGNDVTLTYFQGDWVVLDFWGSWCKYCIVGIPEMKAAYEAYHPQGFEIIGIDCNETEDAWKAAVKRYELPWINVYNPAGRGEGVGALYNIMAYPTKILINPEGYIYSIYLGEDPAFYELLQQIFQ